MAITKTTRKSPVVAPRRRTINASAGVTSNVRPRPVAPQNKVLASLTPEKKAFARQLQQNVRKQSAIMGATNTTNIAMRPDFLELLPLFVQDLLVLDVFGSVAMRSRQQLIPYFKFIAENTKGETKAQDIISSPFVNRQGADPNWTSRIVKNEVVAQGNAISADGLFQIAYTPILPASVTIQYNDGSVTTAFVDDGNGNLCKAGEAEAAGFIDYSTGAFELKEAAAGDGHVVKATYEYDNENVGPRTPDNGFYGHDYGAMMAKGYLQLDEINMVAEAHELACYWSIYSAFAAQQEYGANIADIAKEAAFSELTAEINTSAFAELRRSASYQPQFNWDASPILAGSVVPSDYLNMFKLKLNQAAASVYQATRLAQPNRLIVGSNVGSYIGMMNGFQAAPAAENVGPYHAGKLEQFEVYVDPSYNPDTWVMACKSADIRRNSGLYGVYMPLTQTDPIGLANMSVQSGFATMYGLQVVNPATVVSGKILGVF